MIKKFHVLYVGQIELDNIGLDGTPANDRRYASDRLREAFATARDVAQTMDELGFYALWTAEHHFQHEGYECLPNLIQLGLWLTAQHTRRQIGCYLHVLPAAPGSWVQAAASPAARSSPSARRFSTPKPIATISRSSCSSC